MRIVPFSNGFYEHFKVEARRRKKMYLYSFDTNKNCIKIAHKKALSQWLFV